MTQNQNNKVAHVGEHGLKKHDQMCISDRDRTGAF